MLYSESVYTYYRDSERPPMVATRMLLEQWFAEVPASEQLDLAQRFRSPILRQHRSALFELYLHHLLMRSDFQVQFHPDVPGTQNHPDFLVLKDGTARFYLEAIAVGNSTKEESEVNRINQVYDTLDTLESPDFYVSVRVEGAPASPPAGAKLRKDLTKWLATLNWKEISESYINEETDSIPAYEWDHDGWFATFEPIPKPPEARGSKGVRAIGMTMDGKVRALKLDRDLKKAVSNKDRYGALTLPFVHAIQVVDPHRIDRNDVINGLLGQATVRLAPNLEQIHDRLRNGAWVGPGGAIHRTVSAVCVWSTLEPWNFVTLEPFTILNPYAINPLQADLLPWAQEVPDHSKNELILQPGKPIGEVLGLAIDWLPED
jgi:hypothetical protein